MNNSDLEKLLKSASTPEPAPEFCEKLPGRVTAKLHWQSRRAEASEKMPNIFPQFAWAVTGAACLFIALAVWFSRDHKIWSPNTQMARAEKYLREVEQLFPNQVSAIVFDERGARLVLADKPDVPDSAPLYLKICGARGCQQFVTFSGQQIRVNGEDCDVLQDAAGNVLLVGKNLVWSSNSTRNKAGAYHIEARSLETSS